MTAINTNQNIGIFNVKTHLSSLLQKVQRGQVFIITDRGKPVAKLQPYQTSFEQTKQAVTHLQQIRNQVAGSVNIAALINEGRKY